MEVFKIVVEGFCGLGIHGDMNITAEFIVCKKNEISPNILEEVRKTLEIFMGWILGEEGVMCEFVWVF